MAKEELPKNIYTENFDLNSNVNARLKYSPLIFLYVLIIQVPTCLIIPISIFI